MKVRFPRREKIATILVKDVAHHVLASRECMNAKVRLNVTAGPMRGKEFVFAEHDTFVVGRQADCHCCLPDDRLVSRHHFFMEVNPPDARIRDFGSLNGTHVNGRKIGARAKGETPETGAKRAYPEVEIKHGDVIQAGETTLAVVVEAPPSAAGVVCDRCGKDVAAEAGVGRSGSYICDACRQSMQQDPAQIIRAVVGDDAADHAAASPFPGYRIVKRLSAGGFGVVYLAERARDSHPVAIKVMLSRIAVEENASRKFGKEIVLLKELRHPNIVDLLDFKAEGSAFYFVMEYCPGGSVARYMAEHGGKLSLQAAWPIMLQALEGLAHAHQRGIVHRDLKPGNILLTGTPQKPIAKLSDLGLAKSFEQAGFSGMTLTGAYAGTPVFMPSEQLTNFKYVKPSTDVWSLGATFYNILTGQLPRDFPKGENPLDIILKNEVIPLSQRDPELYPFIAAVIDKALQPLAKDRYQNAGEMLKAMEDCPDL